MSSLLVSGATGFVGQRLTNVLLSNKHNVTKLSRSKSKDTITWNINEAKLDSQELENFDSVIHLAGESILGLWTKTKKEKIYQSRIAGTKLLVDRILKLKNPPKVFIAASAVGIYGQAVDSPANENAPLANDFLANICKEWEAACEPLITAGIRVVNLRIGVVIDPSGGMLKQMLLPFKLGLGAWLGNGKQNTAWVSLEDLVQIINFSLENPTISGPVNAVAPELISNKYFCLSLAKHLRRPCLFGIPKFVLKLLLGKEFSGMILGSQKILPEKLINNNYQFINQSFKSYLSDKQF